nr:MAG TPA: Baseplate structural protein [Caudoviricetes sp.]
MAFTKFTSDVGNIQKLADRPQLEPKALKEVFDKAGEDIKKYVAETLVPEMEAVTAAESIGATHLGDGDPHPENSRNVQAKLNYLYEQIKQTQIGQIPDRSIESIKIASGTLTQNELADGAVTTAKLADGAITQPKLAGGLLDLCPIGMGLAWWSDTLPSDKWMLAGGTLTPGTHDEAIAFFGGTALPDVKGRVIVGKDTGTAAFNALYRTGGAATHTLLTAEMPKHSHDRLLWIDGQPVTLTGSESGAYRASFTYDKGGPNMISTSEAGGGQAHNNLQPYIVANYIFKVL